MRLVAIIVVFFALPATGQLFDSIITTRLNRVYEGQNYYVTNPQGLQPGENDLTPNGEIASVSCIKQVRVNGEIQDIDLSSSMIEVELHHFDFQLGDSVDVRFDHSFDCHPKVIFKDPPYEPPSVINIELQDSLLKWQLSKPHMVDAVFLEELRWGKWVRVKQLDEYKYEHQLKFSKLFSGRNLMRLLLISRTGEKILGPPIEITVNTLPPIVNIDVENRIIEFSRKVRFEVEDKKGKIVQTGYSDVVTLGNRSPYLLRFDNQERKVEFP